VRFAPVRGADTSGASPSLSRGLGSGLAARAVRVRRFLDDDAALARAD